MHKIIIAPILLLLCIVVKAQDNYEIQVYASPTQAKGSTIFVLLSNFTFNGEKKYKR